MEAEIPLRRSTCGLVACKRNFLKKKKFSAKKFVYEIIYTLLLLFIKRNYKLYIFCALLLTPLSMLRNVQRIHKNTNAFENSFAMIIVAYSCGLSTATIEYSCPSVCPSVCVCVRLSVCLCTR